MASVRLLPDVQFCRFFITASSLRGQPLFLIPICSSSISQSFPSQRAGPGGGMEPACTHPLAVCFSLPRRTNRSGCPGKLSLRHLALPSRSFARTLYLSWSPGHPFLSRPPSVASAAGVLRRAITAAVLHTDSSAAGWQRTLPSLPQLHCCR